MYALYSISESKFIQIIHHIFCIETVIYITFNVKINTKKNFIKNMPHEVSVETISNPFPTNRSIFFEDEYLIIDHPYSRTNLIII